MEDYINNFINEIIGILKELPVREIAKAIALIQATYERNGRIYIFGNGGSMALATHWVSDFNKTTFSHYLDAPNKRFQAMRIPPTEEELSAWSNDVGYEMVFAGPLKNFLQETDVIIAISSSGNSPNIVKAIGLAKERGVSVIGLSGFDGGKLKELADVKIHVPTPAGRYDLVEGLHDVILHLITKYFQDYLDHYISQEKTRGGNNKTHEEQKK
ncbi:MAG: hypothetical protein UY15_C0029G0005 [Parcubacteria group bacterium GW2011_GWA2_47_9]|nr:MAG: hypothetical protein UY15_C0029G0005 [Parcubacteria group bacterium GW2011_GWA2_47_9]